MAKKLLPWVKVHPGWYEYIDGKGRKWVCLHCLKNDGYANTEWHVGTEDDPHSNQYSTFEECDYHTHGFLQEGF